MNHKARKKAVHRKAKTSPSATSPERPMVHLDQNGHPRRLPPFWCDDAPTIERFTPPDGTRYFTTGTRIGGIEVPAELVDAIKAHGAETYLWISELMDFEPWRFFDHYAINDGSRYTAYDPDLKENIGVLAASVCEEFWPR